MINLFLKIFCQICPGSGAECLWSEFSALNINTGGDSLKPRGLVQTGADNVGIFLVDDSA